MDGILVLDKPSGLTSHDVVARVRRWTGQRRVGHTGTLDPDVTGVLVLCLGTATRLAEYLSGEDKEYEGVAAFGSATDTQDASGRETERLPNPVVDPEALRQAAREMTGWLRQVPPAFSAVRVRGRRAYDLARRGETVQIAPRLVFIARFEVGEPVARGDLVEVPFTVVCSKGTYVRTLCHDLGRRLGIPAHMASLRRVRQGSFTAADAHPWSRVEEAGQAGRLAELVRAPAWAVRMWPHRHLSEREAEAVRRGRPLAWDPEAVHPGQSPGFRDTEKGEPIALLYRGELAAVYRRKDTCLKPEKVFLQ